MKVLIVVLSMKQAEARLLFPQRDIDLCAPVEALGEILAIREVVSTSVCCKRATM